MNSRQLIDCDKQFIKQIKPSITFAIKGTDFIIRLFLSGIKALIKIIRSFYKIIIIILIFILCFIVIDPRLKVTEYLISSNKIPSSFNGYVIIQVSDLHCKLFGNKQTALIKKIKKIKPQIIVLTGDMFGYQRWNYNNIKNFLEGITVIAPVYAVTGNHEYDDPNMFDILLELYDMYNITLLNDETKKIYIGNESINLYGMYYREYIGVTEDIKETDGNEFNILLYHDPTQLKKLLYRHFNLILSGHTHGGVIRLPVLGGVIGTERNFFPQYDYGYYKVADTVMIVSSGLGNTDIIRVFNRPEIVRITLKKG